MFKKVACFTDIHFGMKGNSRVHNDDCEALHIPRRLASSQRINQCVHHELHSIKHGKIGPGI